MCCAVVSVHLGSVVLPSIHSEQLFKVPAIQTIGCLEDIHNSLKNSDTTAILYVMMLFAHSLNHNHIVQEEFDNPSRNIWGFMCYQMEMQIHSRQIKHLCTLNFYYILFIYFTFHSIHVVVRGQLIAVSSLLLPSGTHDINLWPIGLEAGAFPTEPS